MASITYDKTTRGGFRVRWQSQDGVFHEEITVTHREAQELADQETIWKLKRDQQEYENEHQNEK